MTVNGIKDWDSLSPATQQYHRSVQRANNTILSVGERKKAAETARKAKKQVIAEKSAS